MDRQIALALPEMERVLTARPEFKAALKNLTEELFFSLQAPIILYAPAWGVPERLKEEIPLQRLLRLVQAKKANNLAGLDLATDAEVAAYISTASLEFPLDHDWTEIYLYVATKVMGGDKTPADIRVTELNRNQMDDLNRLKRWIVTKQRQHMKEKRKNEQGNQIRPVVRRALPDPGSPAHDYRFAF